MASRQKERSGKGESWGSERFEKRAGTKELIEPMQDNRKGKLRFNWKDEI